MITGLRIKMFKIFRDKLTGKRLEPGLSKIFRWIRHLDGSSCVTHLLARCLLRSILYHLVFFSRQAWFSSWFTGLVSPPPPPRLLPRKRLIRNHTVCCNFAGLSVSNSVSSPSSYSFSTTSFVSAYLWAVGAMSPLLLSVFR